MSENIICPKCNELFEYPGDYWAEKPNGHIEILDCPKCNAKVKITFETGENFRGELIEWIEKT